MGNCFELQPAFNILTKRPLLLHLCPTEPRPTNRVASVTAPTPTIMYDMPMMSKFVADFYQQKVAEIKSLQAKLASSAPGEIERSSGEGAARHPGDDRDSDDEAEGKVPAAAKKPMATIVNEVEAMGEEVVPEVSGENKAAAELMKIGMARSTEDSTLLMEESDETRMALTQGKGAVGDPV